MPFIDLSILVLGQVMASCLTVHCIFIAYAMKERVTVIICKLTLAIRNNYHGLHSDFFAVWELHM
jgi:hypothetical protein